jgi:hypothetical protein
MAQDQFLNRSDRTGGNVDVSCFFFHENSANGLDRRVHGLVHAFLTKRKGMHLWCPQMYTRSHSTWCSPMPLYTTDGPHQSGCVKGGFVLFNSSAKQYGWSICSQFNSCIMLHVCEAGPANFDQSWGIQKNTISSCFCALYRYFPV